VKVRINSKVVSGQCTTNKAAIRKAFSEFEGKEVTIIIERKRKTRSTKQNSYLWGVIYPLIKQGLFDTHGERFTIDAVHEMMKNRYNYKEIVNESTGEILIAPKSTSENSTIEQEEYYDNCRDFAIEWLGVSIPLPNEGLNFE
jgi:hypothetical protein